MEQFITPRERESALAPVYWNPVVQTSQAVADIYGRALSVEYNFFAGGRMHAVIPTQEWHEVAEYVAERLVHEAGYFERLAERTEKAKQEIGIFLEMMEREDIASLPGSALVGFAERIYALFTAYDAASIFAWFVAGDVLKEKVGERLAVGGEELDVLALPEEQTAASRMERETLEAALSDAPVETASEKLAELYFWMPFGYDGPDTWDAEYFRARIEAYRSNRDEATRKLEEIRVRKEELQRRAEEILAPKMTDDTAQRLVRILRGTARWTDERKTLEFPLFYWYRFILEELGKRYGLSVAELKYLFTHELGGLETDAPGLRDVARRRMSEEFMTISSGGAIRIAEDAELKQIQDLVRGETKTQEIRGSVASRGTESKYTARVKVLRSSTECARVERGDILVATMTTPDYVPAMDRALGFITDEGGVTCHAAIAAREMNKPCIIGTRNATQILVDGDRVEMDMTTGAVRVLG